ncbi:MAG TPA: PEP-utilizing enzyme, partial [Oscillatoriaceae cyanobacterium]
WGVYPRVLPRAGSDEELIRNAMAAAKAEGMIQDGERVVITAGSPLGVPGNTNFIKVEVASTILARGMGLGKTAIVGVARVANSAAEAIAKMQPGDILVARETDKDYVPAMSKASGVIVEAGGLTSHAAIVCLQLNIPLLLEVTGLDKIPDGEVVTMDASRGLVFKGKVKV